MDTIFDRIERRNIRWEQRQYCDPTGISEAALAIGAVASVASVGISAYGAMQTAKATNSAEAYNASVQNQLAANATAQAAIDQKAQEQQTAELKGRQIAAYAGGNVVVNQDTPLDINEETSGYGELDALQDKANDMNQAWGNQNQAVLDLASQVNPVNAGATSLLGGASQVGGTLLNYGLNNVNN